jgi:DNA invertase Pin-like site-specific DNA recombinase
MPTAYPYLRVSNWRQTEGDEANSKPGGAGHGYSLPAQREIIRRYYELRLKDLGFELGPFHEDAAVSGKRQLCDRPEGHKLHLRLERGDVVVIVRSDRAFRNAVDALQCMECWQARGIFFHCAENGMNTQEATGRLCISIMAIGAQWENEVRGQRVKEVKEHRKRQGFWPHPVAPFGFKRVKVKGGYKLALDPAQRAMARRFIAWQTQGWTSIDIYRHLVYVEHALPVGRIRAWSPSTIHNYIKRELRLQELEAEGKIPYAQFLRDGDDHA